MSKKEKRIFCFWGQSFEEQPTTIFTVQMRKAGLNTKIIGLNGQISSGANGVTIRADFVLSQVEHLGHMASCIILPCSAGRIKRIENDPRFLNFCQKACENKALFVVADPSTFSKSFLSGLLQSDDVVFYKPCENLEEMAWQLARSL